MDFSLAVYIAIIVLSGFNLIFGIYWWACERGASTIYKVVLVLWAGLLYSNAIAIYGRTCALVGDMSFLTKWIWHSRSLILLACIAVYSFIIIFRFCGPKDRCSYKDE